MACFLILYIFIVKGKSTEEQDLGMNLKKLLTYIKKPHSLAVQSI